MFEPCVCVWTLLQKSLRPQFLLFRAILSKIIVLIYFSINIYQLKFNNSIRTLYHMFLIERVEAITLMQAFCSSFTKCLNLYFYVELALNFTKNIYWNRSTVWQSICKTYGTLTCTTNGVLMKIRLIMFIILSL